ncbi:MAG TPA: aldo/keto reductase, partial [Planctomycetota bacterium]|nr:aldo/keto reductase [Planctomycetota bacterium]
MEKRKLGTSDIEVSRVILGAWAIGGGMWGGTDVERSIETIRASLDAGVTTIDTAPAYGFGLSEEIVGRAIAGRRNEVVIATKCGLRWDRDDGAFRFELPTPEGGVARIHHNLKPDSIREECEASLRRLRTDHIDLYQIHWPDPIHPLEDSLAELVRLRDEGKVRAIGVSNFSVPELETALSEASIVSDQPQYNLLDRRIEKDVLPWCRAHDVGVICYSPMARGLLTGKIAVDHQFPETDHRKAVPWFERAFRQKVADALETIRPISTAHGVSLGNL